MNGWLWLFIGALVGLLNVACIAGMVARLRPGWDVRAASTLVSGFALRLILSALVLVVALRQSAAAGLFAFAGLWLARWAALFWTHAKCGVRSPISDV